MYKLFIALLAFTSFGATWYLMMNPTLGSLTLNPEHLYVSLFASAGAIALIAVEWARIGKTN